MHYSFKSTPTTSFKSRNETITKSNQPSAVPGPTHYNVSKPLPKSATIAQTKQKRELFKFVNQAPGPGSYQPKSYITAGPHRSMSARLIREPEKTPGPLDYQAQLLKTKSKAPNFSMGNKSKSLHKIIEENNLNKPGPGNYNPENILSKSTTFNFGISTRKDLTETQKTPAPNYYSPQKMTYSSVMNPRCKIGSQKRQLKIKDIESTPGPAGYNLHTFIDENNQSRKGFTCRSKIKDLIAQQLAKNPGPGQYKSQTLNFKQTAPRCATTQTKRETFIDQAKKSKQEIPAFSGSESNLFNSSKYRASSASIFGNSKRRALDQNQRTPGPLAYDTDRLKIMNKQPAFSCTKSPSKNQFLKNGQLNNPGPGYYDAKIELVKQGKRNSIVLKSNRPDFEKQREKPGVGQYDLLKEKEFKFGYTKEKRISFTDHKNQAKDGTFYNIGSGISNPPSYMKIESKIKFSPEKSLLRSTGGF